MGELQLISGFVGVGINMAFNQIVDHIKVALHCRKELSALKDVAAGIDPIITQIQQHRQRLNMNRTISALDNYSNASAVNVWLKKLESLLIRASEIAQQCAIPRFNIISRYQTSKRIIHLISEIEKHLKLVPLIHLAETEELRLESIQASTSSSASTSMQAIVPTSRGFFIEEPLIVGQKETFAILEKFVVDTEGVLDAEGEGNSLVRIGVVGKGGAGKTLLLKRVFNSQKVRDLFKDDLLLWLTVSNFPSYTNLRNELCMQIVMLTKIDFDRNMGDEYAKLWLNQMLQTHRFALFLDDLWRDGSKLMEELGLLLLIQRSNSMVIASSRDRRVLSELGVAETSIIRMGDLVEEDSWHLFANHAFPYNNGNLPENIDEETAKAVCANCGGLPLAIKVIGRAMAGITQPQEWEMAAERFPIDDSHEQAESSGLYKCLRLSYDALGNNNVNLQLCFLTAATAFLEDQIVHAEFHAIPLWTGEGLLQPHEGYEATPFEMGKIYVDQLADRCLIEPTMRDFDGSVIYFRIHDVLRNLAIQIAEREESFYCRVGRHLTVLNENDCLRCTRILLNDNNLRSLPASLRGPKICSWLMNDNRQFTKFPRRLLGSMSSLKVLDLSDTSIQSLPHTVGCLKQLISLRLRGVPITVLPPSLVNLVNLQILDLSLSSITELPYDIHKLRSLRYLCLYRCLELQYLPYNISKLTSLQRFEMFHCTHLWAKPEGRKKVASIQNLSSLTQLKRLYLENHGEAIKDGTLQSMTQMETLLLTLTGMATLPLDIVNMVKLKRFWLVSSHLLKIDCNIFKFQNLRSLKLTQCWRLEELPDLQKLSNLRELIIIDCPKIEKFYEEYGEMGAFPRLEILSLVRLNELQELPEVEEGAFPSLKVFNIMQCEALKMLPESYLNIKRLEKIRVYGCSIVLKNLEKIKIISKRVDMVTMSTSDTTEFVKRYLQVCETTRGWLYGEFWSTELFLFCQYLDKQ